MNQSGSPTTHDFIPSLYHSIFPKIFSKPISKEQYATCNQCSMVCQSHQPTPPPKHHQYFLSSTKCCTFHPIMPNYLIGRVLRYNDMPNGKTRILQKIKNKEGVTPHGIFPPHNYLIRYKKKYQTHFGKDESLRCPYYISSSGHCSIWNARSSICSTYFCRYSDGSAGEQFWNTVQLYLMKIENILSQYALHKLNLSANMILDRSIDFEKNILLHQSPDTLPMHAKPDVFYSRIWGNWENREEELYEKTYQIIHGLTPQQFNKITGITGTICQQAITDAYLNITQPSIPKYLKISPNITTQPINNSHHIYLIGEHTLRVDPIVIKALNCFNGIDSTDTVIQTIESTLHADISPEFIMHLYWHQFLVSPEH